MKLENILLEKVPSLNPDIYSRAKNSLLETMNNAKRKYDQHADRPRVDDFRDVEVQKSSSGKHFIANIQGSLRFSSLSKVFTARRGEEDDDFPEVNRKAVQEMQKMFERVLKIQGFKIQKESNKPTAKGKVTFWVEDSEKFFMEFGVQIGF